MDGKNKDGDYQCPNCGETKPDYREECPNPDCRYTDKQLKKK